MESNTNPIQCPFCFNWHPDDQLCGCHDEIADYNDLLRRAELGEPLTRLEKVRLATYDMLA